jgi:putative secretion ATPase (PEP-CTERM system associated)
MYEDYYHLRDKPFQLNPDPRFYYPSEGHKRASSYLEYGLSEGQGVIIVTGDVGAGKTLMANGLIQKITGGDYLVAKVMGMRMNEDDALRSVVAAFGLDADNAKGKAALVKALEDYLRMAVRQYRRPLLIVDEAQYLNLDALEDLRLITNLHEGDRPLMQCILLGHPEFRDILNSPEMAQLSQRVVTAYHLGPLEPEEIGQYINSRLKAAGWAGGALFLPDTYAPIHEYTQGIPRRINTLCDRLMLFGYLEERRSLDAACVAEVIADLERERRPIPKITPRGIDDMSAGDMDAYLNALTSGLDAKALEDMGERLAALERAVNRLQPMIRKILFTVTDGKEHS